MSNGRLEQLGTPTEVYRPPSTAFVARFVGAMNELPGTVSGPDRVDVSGVVVPVSTSGRFSPGEHVIVLVRPEDVEVTPVDGDAVASDGGAEGLVGSVVNQTFAGAGTLVHVRLDRLDQLITAHSSSTRADRLVPGTRVAVTVDGEHALCEAPDAVTPVEVAV